MVTGSGWAKVRVSDEYDIMEIQVLGPLADLTAPHVFVDVNAQNNMVAKSLTSSDGFCKIQQTLGPGSFATGSQVSSMLSTDGIDSCAGGQARSVRRNN
jgi:hypothetical protein